jgi:ribose transport system permease protein
LLVGGFPIPLAMLIGIAVGAVLGIINGQLVTRFKLPPFIATLGMLGIARGVVLVITDANTIQGLPDSFQKIANGTVVGIPNLLIILPRDHRGRVVRAQPHRIWALRVLGGLESGSSAAGRRAGRVGHRFGVRNLRAARRVGGVLLTSRLGAGIPTAGTGFRTAGDRGLCHRRRQPVRRAR